MKVGLGVGRVQVEAKQTQRPKAGTRVSYWKARRKTNAVKALVSVEKGYIMKSEG